MKLKYLKTLVLSSLAVALVGVMLPVRVFAISSDSLVALTNQQRQTQGLAPLSANSELMASAAAKAADMLANDYWSHNSPSGVEPWFFIKQSGYSYKRAGENLAMSFDSDDAVVSAWMNSPEHRANILNPDYQDIGIAVVEGSLLGKETTLVVAHYGTPLSAPVTAQAAPQAPQTTVASAVESSKAPQPQPTYAATAAKQPAVEGSTSAKPSTTSAIAPKSQLPTSVRYVSELGWSFGLLAAVTRLKGTFTYRV